MTVQASRSTGKITTMLSGIAAPMANVSAEVCAACTGRAVVTSDIPNSSRRCVSSASFAVIWTATCRASAGATPRTTWIWGHLDFLTIFVAAQRCVWLEVGGWRSVGGQVPRDGHGAAQYYQTRPKSEGFSENLLFPGWAG